MTIKFFCCTVSVGRFSSCAIRWITIFIKYNYNSIIFDKKIVFVILLPASVARQLWITPGARIEVLGGVLVKQTLLLILLLFLFWLQLLYLILVCYYNIIYFYVWLEVWKIISIVRPNLILKTITTTTTTATTTIELILTTTTTTTTTTIELTRTRKIKSTSSTTTITTTTKR